MTMKNCRVAKKVICWFAALMFCLGAATRFQMIKIKRELEVVTSQEPVSGPAINSRLFAAPSSKGT